MKRRSSGYLVMVCGLFLVIIVWAALPRPGTVATADYARQTGQPCPVCHERPEGGGALSATGATFVRGGYQWPIPEAAQAAQPEPRFRIPRAVRLIVGYVHLATAIAWFGTIFYIHVMVGAKSLTSGIPRAETIVGRISIVVMATTGTVLTLYRFQETGVVFSGTFGTVKRDTEIPGSGNDCP